MQTITHKNKREYQALNIFELSQTKISSFSNFALFLVKKVSNFFEFLLVAKTLRWQKTNFFKTHFRNKKCFRTFWFKAPAMIDYSFDRFCGLQFHIFFCNQALWKDNKHAIVFWLKVDFAWRQGLKNSQKNERNGKHSISFFVSILSMLWCSYVWACAILVSLSSFLLPLLPGLRPKLVS